MRDDYDFNSAFCKLVEKHPLLYDYTHLEYSNKFTQDAAWQAIAKELKQPVNDCKERWRNIRARYGKFLKSKEKKGSKKFVREYYLAPFLTFLDNCYRFKNKETDKETHDKDTIREEEVNSPEEISQEEFEEQPSPSPVQEIPTKKRRVDFDDANSEADLDFLKSLLPDMRAMTDAQKRKFKIGVLSLAGDVLDDGFESVHDRGARLTYNEAEIHMVDIVKHEHDSFS